MAQNNTKVLLGFDDELITDKYKEQVNFTTNKIGGKPDWPSNLKVDNPVCPLCHLPRPLVVQIYAPLENSTYHRTLYLFACINPNCWNRSESWSCIRVQTQKKVSEPEETAASNVTKASVIDWCSGANDWDDNISNVKEENGNVINNNERISDEEDESCSFEEAIRTGFGNLSIDDRNANVEAQGGAVGRLHSPAATAELEPDEGEVISIDTPTMPQHDITALLQEATPLPSDICQNCPDVRRFAMLQLVSSFMAVWEEQLSNVVSIGDNHVRELLQEYQLQNDDAQLNPDWGGGAVGGHCTEMAYENYENSNPAHGDKMFHHFSSKIQQNPGQILRYSREVEPPLLLYPLQEIPRVCEYCQGEMIFEFQLLPTIIPKLRLVSDSKSCTRLEFGTVLVFTCRKSCWSTDSTQKYETVILQSEIY